MINILKNILDRNSQKKFLINFFNYSALFALLFFGIKYFSEKNFSKLAILILFFGLTVGNLIYFNIKNKIKFAALFTAILFFVFEITLFIFVRSAGNVVFWLFLYPLVSIMLTEEKTGILLSVFLFLLIITSYLIFNDLTSVYSTELMLRVFIIYAIITYMTYINEFSKKKLDKKLKENYSTLKEKNIELRAAQEIIRINNQELTKAYKDLQNNEKYLKRLIDNLGDGLVILDLNGNFKFLNKVASKMYDYIENESLLGKNFKFFFDKEYIDKISEKIEVVKQGKTVKIEVSARNKNNKILYLLATMFPEYNNQNEIIGIISLFKNITDIKIKEQQLKEKNDELLATEEEVRQQNEQLKLLNTKLRKISVAIEQAPVSIIITDTRGIIEYVNPHFTELTGYEFHEAVGQNPRILKTSFTPPEKFKEVWDTITAGKVWQGTFINKRKDGAIFYEKAVIAPVKFDNDKIVNFIGIKEDMTKLIEQQEELREKSEQQRRLINNLPVYIFYKDINLRYLLVNEKYASLLGVTEEEMIGKRYTEIFPNDPRGKEFEDFDRKILKKREGIYNVENQYINKNGTEYWVSVSKVPYFNDKGEPAGIVGIVQDITEQKAREQQIIEMNKELAKYYVAIEQSPVGIVFLNNEGIREYVNNAYLSITGYKKEEVLNKQSFIFQKKEVKEKLLKGETVRLEFQRKAKREFYERLLISPSVDFYDNVLNYVAIIDDITIQKQQQDFIIKQHKELLEANERIEESINYAKNIQTSLLPDKKAIKIQYNYDNFLLYKPKNIISGDFYYFNKIDNYFIFSVADCTGHGVPGAFISIIGYTMLNEVIIKENVTNTAKILNILRVKIKKIFKNFHGGMDIALCIYNEKTKELQYSGAYNPLIIISENQLIEYKGDRNPIGSYPVERDFKQVSVKIKPNDIIYLFSDGFTDQMALDKKDSTIKFSKKRFKNLLLEISSKPMHEQKQILEKTLAEWKKDEPQTDDITVLGIKLR